MGPLAQPKKYYMETLSHEPGGSNTISAQLVAALRGCDLPTVQSWATGGECFLELVWVFPGSNFPQFTTRHLLVLGTNSSFVSFSGGIAWAQRIWKNSQPFQIAEPPVYRCLYQALPLPMHARARQKLPLQPLLRNCPAFCQRSRSGYLQQATTLQPSGRADDELSVCSELTCATTISDADTDGPSDSASDWNGPEVHSIDWPENGPSSLDWTEPWQTPFAASGSSFTEDDWNDDTMAKEQLQTELLQRQNRDAQAMFARNGDTSGFLQLIRTANQLLGSQEPTGLPRFQF